MCPSPTRHVELLCKFRNTAVHTLMHPNGDHSCNLCINNQIILYHFADVLLCHSLGRRGVHYYCDVKTDTRDALLLSPPL